MKKQKHRHHGPRPAHPQATPIPALDAGRGAGRKKILLAIPAYTGQLHYTTIGAINLIYSEASQLGWEVALSMRTTDSIITRCRNVMLADFVRSDCTDMLFLDSDVSFGPGVFARLMSHQVDLVAGIYRVRADPEQYPVRPLKDYLQYDASGSGLMEVEAVPTGCLRISRRCAETLTKAYAEDWYEDVTAKGLRIVNVFDFELVGHEYWSEDYVFCKRWAALGGKVWIDPDVELNHAGDKVFTGCFGSFLRQQFEKVHGHPPGTPPAPALQSARASVPAVATPAKLSDLVRATIDNAA